MQSEPPQYPAIFQLIAKGVHTVCFILFVGLMLSVLWQVVSRGLFHKPATFTEELARFIFIWLALIGAAAAYIDRAHLMVDYFVKKASETKQKIFRMFSLAVVVAFAFLVMVVGGLMLMVQTLGSSQLSPVLNFPMGWIYACVPLAGIVITGFAVLDLFSEVRAKPSSSRSA